MGAALLTNVRAPIPVHPSHRLNSELAVICLSATVLGSFLTLWLLQFNQTPLYEFLTQELPGGTTALLLSAAGIALFLGRRLWSASALLSKALADRKQSEEKLRALSAKLEKQERDRMAGPRYTDQPLQGKTSIPVLLVDDHTMVRQGLRSVMESFPNIEIIGEASNGNEALKLVEKRRPAVVLMDINMPHLNGIEATAKIKTEYPEVAVIGLSVNTESANQEAMKKAGANMLLPKEAVIAELYSAILAVSTPLASKE